MRKIGRPYVLAVALLFLKSSPVLVAQEELKPEEIIERFAAKESEFLKLWNQYTYRQDVLIEVLNDMGRVVEQKRLEFEVYFTNQGERKTRLVDEQGELRSIGITEEDMQDFIELQPFVLTTEHLPDYDIEYKGTEWVDELHTYIFDVKPKKIEKGKRYFEGRVWVDDLDLQIVRTKGKIVPDYRDNKFPEFETLRQQVDGENWFPVWIKADDHLTFGNFWNRRSVHVREWITLEDFQKYEVGTSIRYVGPETGEETDSSSEPESPPETKDPPR